jgi:hypothetical protein
MEAAVAPTSAASVAAEGSPAGAAAGGAAGAGAGGAAGLPGSPPEPMGEAGAVPGSEEPEPASPLVFRPLRQAGRAAFQLADT